MGEGVVRFTPPFHKFLDRPLVQSAAPHGGDKAPVVTVIPGLSAVERHTGWADLSFRGCGSAAKAAIDRLRLYVPLDSK